MAARMVGEKEQHSVAGKVVWKVDLTGMHLAEHLVEH